MSHLDDEISTIFKNSEIEMTEKIVSLLDKNNNIKIDNSREKLHIIMGIIDNLCHEIVYHKHKNINYDIMKKEVINIAINILK